MWPIKHTNFPVRKPHRRMNFWVRWPRERTQFLRAQTSLTYYPLGTLTRCRMNFLCTLSTIAFQFPAYSDLVSVCTFAFFDLITYEILHTLNLKAKELLEFAYLLCVWTFAYAVLVSVRTFAYAFSNIAYGFFAHADLINVWTFGNTDPDSIWMSFVLRPQFRMNFWYADHSSKWRFVYADPKSIWFSCLRKCRYRMKFSGWPPLYRMTFLRAQTSLTHEDLRMLNPQRM